MAGSRTIEKQCACGRIFTCRQTTTATKRKCDECRQHAQKVWRANNPERLKSLANRYREKDRQRNREYSKQETDALSDRYVLKALRLKAAPSQLIAVKRAQLLVSRILKEQTS